MLIFRTIIKKDYEVINDKKEQLIMNIDGLINTFIKTNNSSNYVTTIINKYNVLIIILINYCIGNYSNEQQYYIYNERRNQKENVLYFTYINRTENLELIKNLSHSGKAFEDFNKALKEIKIPEEGNTSHTLVEIQNTFENNLNICVSQYSLELGNYKYIFI